MQFLSGLMATLRHYDFRRGDRLSHMSLRVIGHVYQQAANGCR
jgi:hypothetical protein